MANPFIGRKLEVGIAKESTRGTCLTPTYWIPHAALGFQERADKVMSDMAVGHIAQHLTAVLSDQYAEGTLEGEVRTAPLGLLLLATLVASTTPAWALYIVEREDGGVSEIYRTGRSKSIEDELKKIGLEGRPYFRTSPDELPDYADRQFWTAENNRVVVDQVKKAAWEAEQAAEEQKKKDVLAKLKITEQEWKELCKGKEPGATDVAES